ncbi:MAG: transcriptional activator NhaR [bacterium]
MEWLNYHHLLYFWVVAREGSIAKATRELRLAQPTISGQLRMLERSLGTRLLRREGRGLVLTEMGQIVYRYADEIFSIGRELMDTVKDRPTGRPLRFTVGIADAIPKLVAYRLIEAALKLPEPVALVCREDQPERLLGQLALHELDLVISDGPLPPGVSVRAFNHLLGECGVAFHAAPELAKQLRKGFPRSLHGAPMLMPSEHTSLRRALEQWFDAQEIRPRTVAEFDDTALLKTFGQSGLGVFPVSTVIENEAMRQYGSRRIGVTEDVRERFYAISAERRLKHPAVLAICDLAREKLFG